MIDFQLLKAKIICSKWYQWYLWKRYDLKLFNRFICRFFKHRWNYYPFKEQIINSMGEVKIGYYEFVDTDGYRCLAKCNCGVILIDEKDYLGIADSRLNHFISIKSG